MSGRAWQFRTTEGLVTVERDAITIRSTPGEVLAGQWTRFRNGGATRRLKTVGRLFLLLTVPVTALQTLRELLDASVLWVATLYVLVLGGIAYGFWASYFRETTVELSEIESIALNEETRTLRIVEDSPGRLQSLLGEDQSERTLPLPTADDVREARDVLDGRGIDYDDGTRDDGSTTYRVRTRGGVCFCERCNTQVSPSDRVCPACDYALRVEQAASV